MWRRQFQRVEPTEWGPTFWKTIYYICFTYDIHQEPVKQMVEMFFYSLGGLLPCPDCQEHYRTYYEKNNIKLVLNDKMKLLQWVYHLENEIATRNQKTFPDFHEWMDSREKLLNLE